MASNYVNPIINVNHKFANLSQSLSAEKKWQGHLVKECLSVYYSWSNITCKGCSLGSTVLELVITYSVNTDSVAFYQIISTKVFVEMLYINSK